MLITDILLPLVTARFWLTKFLFSTTIKSVRHEFKIKGRAAADIAISAVWLICDMARYLRNRGVSTPRRAADLEIGDPAY